MLRCQCKTVYGARSVLPQVHLVDIALKDLVFLVMQVEQHSHQHLCQLAYQRALGGKVIILHQLLRDSTAAGDHLPGTQITKGCTGDTANGKTPVLVKTAILYRDQTGQKDLRDIVELYQHPVLPLARNDSTQPHRIKPHQVYVRTTR
jgi:hypothetical protein